MIQSSSPSSRAGGPGGGGGGAIARVSAVKVVVLGPPSVGSSSLVRRFCVDTFEEDDDDDEEKSGTRAASSAHTWGARFHSKLLLVAGGEGHVLRFQIWDVPGGDELLAPVYLAQTLAAALQLLQGVSAQDRPNLVSALVLVGCKADLGSGDMSAVLNEAAAAAIQHNCAFVAATSSKDGSVGSPIQSLFVRSALIRDQAVLRAPAWVPDNLRECCVRCDEKFSALVRRHHCRNCGDVFCNACSNVKCALPRFGFEHPTRVCQDCYAVLTE